MIASIQELEKLHKIFFFFFKALVFIVLFLPSFIGLFKVLRSDEKNISDQKENDQILLFSKTCHVLFFRTYLFLLIL